MGRDDAVASHRTGRGRIMSTYVRGVLTTVTGAPAGYIQAISGTNNAEKHVVKDSTGLTQKNDNYDKSEELRVTVRLADDHDVAIGTVVTVGACRRTGFNGKYTVEPGSTFSEENEDSPVAELVLLRFSDSGLPAQA